MCFCRTSRRDHVAWNAKIFHRLAQGDGVGRNLHERVRVDVFKHLRAPVVWDPSRSRIPPGPRHFKPRSHAHVVPVAGEAVGDHPVSLLRFHERLDQAGAPAPCAGSNGRILQTWPSGTLRMAAIEARHAGASALLGHVGGETVRAIERRGSVPQFQPALLDSVDRRRGGASIFPCFCRWVRRAMAMAWGIESTRWAPNPKGRSPLTEFRCFKSVWDPRRFPDIWRS
jgi:hypothetical protein